MAHSYGEHTKRQMMQEKRRRWMESKSLDESRQAEAAAIDTRSTYVERDWNDELLSKITARLADSLKTQLRKEVASELRPHGLNQHLVKRLEEYLQSELQSHVCGICFELMEAPARSPMLLFPCGHTFCKQCLATHMDQRSSSSKCPQCRALIRSTAENHSLKRLIEQFVSEKRRLEEGEQVASVSDVFAWQAHAGSHTRAVSAGNSATALKAAQHLSSCETRQEILNEELIETRCAAMFACLLLGTSVLLLQGALAGSNSTIQCDGHDSAPAPAREDKAAREC
jgi:hypothetical protein